jgi:hypothetical protein
MPTAASATPRQRRTTAGTSRLCLTVVSAALRQRCAAAGCLWLGLTVVSVVLRRRCAAAGCLWLCLTVVSAGLRQRCTTAGCSWLCLTAVSAVLRQRCTTAGCSWLCLTVVSSALIRRWVAAGLGCRLPEVDDRGLAGSDVTRPAGFGRRQGRTEVWFVCANGCCRRRWGRTLALRVREPSPGRRRGRTSGVRVRPALLRRRCWAVRPRRRDRGGVADAVWLRRWLRWRLLRWRCCGGVAG